jgi:hypothetical protein
MLAFCTTNERLIATAQKVRITGYLFGSFCMMKSEIAWKADHVLQSQYPYRRDKINFKKWQGDSFCHLHHFQANLCLGV